MASVFPRRNLPAEAEPWGREIENAIRNVEYGFDRAAQTGGNLGRSNQGSLNALASTLRTTPILRSVTDVAEGYVLSGTSTWTDAVAVGLVVPEGKTRMQFSVTNISEFVIPGTTTGSLPRIRTAIDGSPLAPTNGIAVFGVGGSSTNTVAGTVTSAGQISVADLSQVIFSAQVHRGSYTSSNSANNVVLSVRASFL